MFKKTSKNLIVAGNGPSLARINPNSMPNDFDLFRCNQFYAEDKYYLGKKIKLAMFNPNVINSQIKTSKALQKEYEIEQIVLNYFDESWDCRFDIQKFVKNNPNILILRNLIEQNQVFVNYIKHLISKGLRLTSGVHLIMFGVIFQYENIYYSGIDFYESDNLNATYSYQIGKNMKKMIYFNECVIDKNLHNKNTDLSGINFLIDYAAKYGIKIQRLDDGRSNLPTNFVSEFGINAKAKLQNAIKDILIADEIFRFKDDVLKC